jgi:hypothetical protein
MKLASRENTLPTCDFTLLCREININNALFIQESYIQEAPIDGRSPKIRRTGERTPSLFSVPFRELSKFYTIEIVTLVVHFGDIRACLSQLRFGIITITFYRYFIGGLHAGCTQ